MHSQRLRLRQLATGPYRGYCRREIASIGTGFYPADLTMPAISRGVSEQKRSSVAARDIGCRSGFDMLCAVSGPHHCPPIRKLGRAACGSVRHWGDRTKKIAISQNAGAA